MNFYTLLRVNPVKLYTIGILWPALLMCLNFSSCKKEVRASANTDPVTQLNVAQANTVNVTTLGAKGDGITDNTPYLQNALNTKKALYIPKGTYLISKPLVKTADSITILSDGAVIKLVPSFPAGVSDASGALLLSNLSYVNISGLTIDGNRGNLKYAGTDWTNYIKGIEIVKSSNIRLANCNVINAPSVSYSFKSCKQIALDHCNSTNGMYHGIDLNYCTNVTVTYSRIIGIGNQGTNIKVGGIGILGTGGSNLTFNNCYIENISDTGTKTEGTNNVTWNADTVINSGKDGIKFQNLAGSDQVYGSNPEILTVYNGTITNSVVNRIFNGRYDGSSEIQVWNASNVVVANNTITGGTKTGQEDGINVWSTVGTTKNITINNNRITNTNRFIYLGTVSEVTVTNNICRNAVAAITSYNGFCAENSSNFKVSNNVFEKAGTGTENNVTVSLFDCGSFSFTSNTVKKGYTALTARLKASRNVRISDNTFDSFGNYCASISVNSAQTIDSLLLSGNVISHVGMNGPVGWMFRIVPTNLTCYYLDFTNTQVIGNGNNGDFGLTVTGTGDIRKTNFTNFTCTGNAIYPTRANVDACTGFIGWRGN